MTEPTPDTLRLRRLLDRFLQRHARSHQCVRAVVVYGSVALGTAGPDSDLDAFVVMDPVDTALLPAEAIWNPERDDFRSIFSKEPLAAGELQLDLARVSLEAWTSEEPWPTATRAALTHRWVAFERPGTDIEALISARTAMADIERRELIDRALLDADGLLEDPAALWQQDPLRALDALNLQWEAILAATFAINRVWLPYRGRAMRSLRLLPWRGALTDEALPACIAGEGRERDAFLARAEVLTTVSEGILERLQDEPDYGEDPIFAAFLRTHDEPGRAWNLAEWNAARAARPEGEQSRGKR